MKYTKVIISVTLIIAAFTVNGRDLSLADMIQLNHLNSNYWEWLTSDSLLSHSIIQDFIINQKEDTIFIDCFEESGGSINVIIWNKIQTLSVGKKDITDSTFIIRKISTQEDYWHSKNDKNLLKDWNIDSLQKLFGPRSPIIRHFVHRFVINEKGLKVDTAGFYPQGIDKERWVKDSEAKYSISRNDNKDMGVEKKNYDRTDKIVVKEPTRSLWQRIVDWFRGLWKAIFG
ncbi:MAG: hypothetical protein K2G00_06840 [Duncaniella sp.]|nr:hypothetical protein [Duncaniella sp.]MDE6062450.1 hypothetical protein [Duncaniella sp.]MDE6813027.1 hypothetical protein [Duncaniella sp.]